MRALTHALETGRLHHAYLFTGTRGVGKTTLARILAKCLNCAAGVSATPCGTCEPCQAIDAGRFSDLLEVDAATNTRVEEMRELLDNAHYAPVSGRFKVYIIDEVHMLSKHAFNAMLKTLEEPPAHMKFILATTDPHKVPVTVLSRCLQFGLKPMTVDQLVSRLDLVLTAEAVPFEPAALRLVARAANGSVRDSLSVLDQAIAFGSGRIETDAVASLLGVGSDEALLGLAQGLATRDRRRVLETVAGMISAGLSAEDVLQDFARLMQQVALLQLVPEGLGIAGEAPDPAHLQLAAQFDAPTVQLCYQIALAGRRDLVHAPDEAAGLTMSFVRMLAFLPGGNDTPAGSPPTAAGGMGQGPAALGRQAGSPAAGSRGAAAGAAAVSAATPAATPAAIHAVGPAATPAAAIAATPSVPPSATPAAHLPDCGADWLALVDQLPAAGTALELARHALWQGRHANRLHLIVPQHHKLLLTAQERLTGLLAALVGPVQLEIRLEQLAADAVPAVTESVAARDDALRAARLAAAERAIQADPVVQRLTGDYGARLLAGSVRPRDHAA